MFWKYSRPMFGEKSESESIEGEYLGRTSRENIEGEGEGERGKGIPFVWLSL